MGISPAITASVQPAPVRGAAHPFAGSGVKSDVNFKRGTVITSGLFWL